jgi:TPR repeat protein
MEFRFSVSMHRLTSWEIDEDIARAAEQGDADAKYNLGARYGTGLGIKQDYAQAMQ